MEKYPWCVCSADIPFRYRRYGSSAKESARWFISSRYTSSKFSCISRSPDFLHHYITGIRNLVNEEEGQYLDPLMEEGSFPFKES